jgi:phospholipase/lecithinase/hemolysin
MLKKSLAITGFLIISVSAQAASEYVVFGDSYSDPNVSYGANWVEHLSSSTGIASDNYAQNGATTSVINNQVSTYLNSTSGVADGDALYFLEGGGNDAARELSEPGNEVTAVNNIQASVDQLVSAGATKIVLFGLFDMSLSPLLNRLGLPPYAEYPWVNYYNAELAAIEGNSQVDILFYDFFSVSREIEVELGASMWADEIHMTTQAHAYIAHDLEQFIAISEVPVPAAAWLFGSALLGLGAIKRKRS